MPAFAELAARSNFSFLGDASHPEELVETAQALGLAGLGLCEQGGGAALLGGCRLQFEGGPEWLAWLGSRATYGRLTVLLSRGRMQAARPQDWRGKAPCSRLLIM